MEEKEINVQLKAIQRVDQKDEKRHYYFDYTYEGDLQYEFEGKTYQICMQADSASLLKNEIRLDFYPAALNHFGKEKMPDYVFENMERVIEANRASVLFMIPKKISMRKASDYGAASDVEVPFLAMEIQTIYSFDYKGEIVHIEYSGVTEFLVIEK